MMLLNAWLMSSIVSENDKSSIRMLTTQQQKENFSSHLDFGTGGIRNKLGLGSYRLNSYTIARISYGVGQTLLQQHQKPSVVIGYDTRNYSEAFAKITANTLSELGIVVFLFKTHQPTPLISFATNYLKAHLGIMITASHNPPIYNGYKIYDNHGCQLVPHQAVAYQKTIATLPDLIPIVEGKEKLINFLDHSVSDAYLKTILSEFKNPPSVSLNVGYSSLHGTGYLLASSIIRHLGHTLIPVEQECLPDGDFTYVKSSNPEDIEAFIGIKHLWKKTPFDLGFVTDPDADRLGVIVQHHHQLVTLTGNQIGAIMMHDIVLHHKKPNKGFIATTIVSSDLAKIIAKKAKYKVYQTLTGFKYIGELIALHPEETFVFGYEESYGFLLNTAVRDKDAFQAMVRLTTIAEKAKSQGLTLVDLLENCYQTYGYFQDTLITKTFEGTDGPKAIQSFVEKMAKTPLGLFLDHHIIRIENYIHGFSFDHHGSKPLALERSDVIKYFLKEGGWIVFRPSGTEPKLKIYLSLTDPNPRHLQQRFTKLTQALEQSLSSSKQLTSLL